MATTYDNTTNATTYDRDTDVDRDLEYDDEIQNGIDNNATGDAEKGATLGGVGGAVTGAIAGAMTGPVGAVVGGVIGAVAGALGSGAAVAAVDRVDNDNTVSGIGGTNYDNTAYNNDTTYNNGGVMDNRTTAYTDGGANTVYDEDINDVDNLDNEDLNDTVATPAYTATSDYDVNRPTYTPTMDTMNANDSRIGGSPAARMGGNGIPGIQTGGTANDGTPDTRGVWEKTADAVTGDDVDDKTGKVVDHR